MGSPPPPWKAWPRPAMVGGLTCVGFGRADGRELLLVVSHDGRGVFELDGTRVARDPAPIDDQWHDQIALTALGIGPLEGTRVQIAGLWGGGLPLTTRDGWGVEQHGDRVLLRLPYPEYEELVEIHHETVTEIRAVGFSPSGAALVIATSADVTLLTR